ncbi:uncharacterized protein LOC128983940 [Macrosteles quadrilineatus]|uniref:uncharacterized protein LOC128983940 n=1 Tax=Macrosteles quadrilineatus TaxID=74068 RepID=UPI0023E0A32B|nr:uncharacterized protein LOC128983940 [Macrosteles quadrilineatus]
MAEKTADVNGPLGTEENPIDCRSEPQNKEKNEKPKDSSFIGESKIGDATDALNPDTSINSSSAINDSPNCKEELEAKVEIEEPEVSSSVVDSGTGVTLENFNPDTKISASYCLPILPSRDVIDEPKASSSAVDCRTGVTPDSSDGDTKIPSVSDNLPMLRSRDVTHEPQASSSVGDCETGVSPNSSDRDTKTLSVSDDLTMHPSEDVPAGVTQDISDRDTKTLSVSDNLTMHPSEDVPAGVTQDISDRDTKTLSVSDNLTMHPSEDVPAGVTQDISDRDTKIPSVSDNLPMHPSRDITAGVTQDSSDRDTKIPSVSDNLPMHPSRDVTAGVRQDSSGRDTKIPSVLENLPMHPTRDVIDEPQASSSGVDCETGVLEIKLDVEIPPTHLSELQGESTNESKADISLIDRKALGLKSESDSTRQHERISGEEEMVSEVLDKEEIERRLIFTQNQLSKEEDSTFFNANRKVEETENVPVTEEKEKGEHEKTKKLRNDELGKDSRDIGKPEEDSTVDSTKGTSESEMVVLFKNIKYQVEIRSKEEESSLNNSLNLANDAEIALVSSPQNFGKNQKLKKVMTSENKKEIFMINDSVEYGNLEDKLATKNNLLDTKNTSELESNAALDASQDGFSEGSIHIFDNELPQSSLSDDQDTSLPDCNIEESHVDCPNVFSSPNPTTNYEEVTPIILDVFSKGTSISNFSYSSSNSIMLKPLSVVMPRAKELSVEPTKSDPSIHRPKQKCSPPKSQKQGVKVEQDTGSKSCVSDECSPNTSQSPGNSIPKEVSKNQAMNEPSIHQSKRRGRPPKSQKQGVKVEQNTGSKSCVSDEHYPNTSQSPRKRIPEEVSTNQAMNEPSISQSKRRGRPPKSQKQGVKVEQNTGSKSCVSNERYPNTSQSPGKGIPEEVSTNQAMNEPSIHQSKRRGRPPKSQKQGVKVEQNTGSKSCVSDEGSPNASQSVEKSRPQEFSTNQAMNDTFIHQSKRIDRPPNSQKQGVNVEQNTESKSCVSDKPLSNTSQSVEKSIPKQVSTNQAMNDLFIHKSTRIDRPPKSRKQGVKVEQSTGSKSCVSDERLPNSSQSVGKSIPKQVSTNQPMTNCTFENLSITKCPLASQKVTTENTQCTKKEEILCKEQPPQESKFEQMRRDLVNCRLGKLITQASLQAKQNVAEKDDHEKHSQPSKDQGGKEDMSKESGKQLVQHISKEFTGEKTCRFEDKERDLVNCRLGKLITQTPLEAKQNVGKKDDYEKHSQLTKDQEGKEDILKESGKQLIHQIFKKFAREKKCQIEDKERDLVNCRLGKLITQASLQAKQNVAEKDDHEKHTQLSKDQEGKEGTLKESRKQLIHQISEEFTREKSCQFEDKEAIEENTAKSTVVKKEVTKKKSKEDIKSIQVSRTFNLRKTNAKNYVFPYKKTVERPKHYKRIMRNMKKENNKILQTSDIFNETIGKDSSISNLTSLKSRNVRNFTESRKKVNTSKRKNECSDENPVSKDKFQFRRKINEYKQKNCKQSKIEKQESLNRKHFKGKSISGASTWLVNPLKMSPKKDIIGEQNQTTSSSISVGKISDGVASENTQKGTDLSNTTSLETLARISNPIVSLVDCCKTELPELKNYIFKNPEPTSKSDSTPKSAIDAANRTNVIVHSREYFSQLKLTPPAKTPKLSSPHKKVFLASPAMEHNYSMTDGDGDNSDSSIPLSDPAHNWNRSVDKKGGSKKKTNERDRQHKKPSMTDDDEDDIASIIPLSHLAKNLNQSVDKKEISKNLTIERNKQRKELSMTDDDEDDIASIIPLSHLSHNLNRSVSKKEVSKKQSIERDTQQKESSITDDEDDKVSTIPLSHLAHNSKNLNRPVGKKEVSKKQNDKSYAKHTKPSLAGGKDDDKVPFPPLSHQSHNLNRSMNKKEISKEHNYNIEVIVIDDDEDDNLSSTPLLSPPHNSKGLNQLVDKSEVSNDQRFTVQKGNTPIGQPSKRSSENKHYPEDVGLSSIASPHDMKQVDKFSSEKFKDPKSFKSSTTSILLLPLDQNQLNQLPLDQKQLNQFSIDKSGIGSIHKPTMIGYDVSCIPITPNLKGLSKSSENSLDSQCLDTNVQKQCLKEPNSKDFSSSLPTSFSKSSILHRILDSPQPTKTTVSCEKKNKLILPKPKVPLTNSSLQQEHLSKKHFSNVNGDPVLALNFVLSPLFVRDGEHIVPLNPSTASAYNVEVNKPTNSQSMTGYITIPSKLTGKLQSTTQLPNSTNSQQLLTLEPINPNGGSSSTFEKNKHVLNQNAKREHPDTVNQGLLSQKNANIGKVLFVSESDPEISTTFPDSDKPTPPKRRKSCQTSDSIKNLSELVSNVTNTVCSRSDLSHMNVGLARKQAKGTQTNLNTYNTGKATTCKSVSAHISHEQIQSGSNLDCKSLKHDSVRHNANVIMANAEGFSQLCHGKKVLFKPPVSLPANAVMQSISMLSNQLDSKKCNVQDQIIKRTKSKEEELEEYLDGAPPFIKEAFKCENLRNGFDSKDLIFILCLLPDLEVMTNSQKVIFQLKTLDILNEMLSLNLKPT